MNFTKKEIIINTWNLMSRHIMVLSLMVIFIFSLVIMFGQVQDKLMENITYQSIVFIIASSLFNQGISLGLISVSFDIINEKEISLLSLFSGFYLLGQYVISTILYFALLFVLGLPGLLLLGVSLYVGSGVNLLSIFSILIFIIPVAYLSIRLQFYNYVLIEKEGGIVNSLTSSFNISKGVVLELFMLGAYLSLIIVLSLIPLVISLTIGVSPLIFLFSVPVGLSFIFTVIALGYTYTILKN